MADKKDPFESLLPRAIEALQSIQNSLSVLADVQLAAEFTPDHESRTRVYRLFDAAKKRDSDAADAIQALRERIDIPITDEKNTELRLQLKEAMDHRSETMNAIADLSKLFPAQSRLHRLDRPQEKR